MSVVQTNTIRRRRRRKKKVKERQSLQRQMKGEDDPLLDARDGARRRGVKDGHEHQTATVKRGFGSSSSHAMYQHGLTDKASDVESKGWWLDSFCGGFLRTFWLFVPYSALSG
ncbi:hypothetical protein CEXT_657301 [Caerostris extrusa]|uniref:Uncharacterized protein n=1 Tax=Caerostris extrusa TaxID=172846 RepID=A0AAV4PQZ5_CAEEX|nr:hypothetical protein CEXT_657301 [Caerostris extrusa]